MLRNWLYKVDANGQMRVWRMEFDGLRERGEGGACYGRYRTISGLKLGEKVTTGWVTAKANSLRDGYDQAMAKVDALYARALKTDYHLTEEEALKGPRHVEPMLAKEYGKADRFLRDMTNWDAQPKLDGIRAILRAEGAFSRTGERFLTTRLVEEALAPLFAADPALVLDGELYNHAYHDRFNELSGKIRKGVNAKRPPTAAELAQVEQLLQYHVYDVASHDGTHVERRAFLEGLDLDSPYLRLVESVPLASREHGDEVYARHLSEGYEGTMYRARDAHYMRGRRPWCLLKRKDFETAEFQIRRVEEGEGDWKGRAKRLVFGWHDGREFAAGLRGDMAFAQRLLRNHVEGTPEYVSCTVRYMPPPQGALPRVAVAVDFHGPDGRLD